MFLDSSFTTLPCAVPEQCIAPQMAEVTLPMLAQGMHFGTLAQSPVLPELTMVVHLQAGTAPCLPALVL